LTLLAIDVGYSTCGAKAAGVEFDDWTAAEPISTWTSETGEAEAYIPGEFYKRELPCILRLLSDHQLQPDCIVVDGFVYLDGFSKPGLGKHLFNALAGGIPIIGVAKTVYAGIPHRFQVIRAKSKRPLFVTSEGIDVETAKELVRSMHGSHRIPTLLKIADRLSHTS
jgi:deoxyribonuclease V